MNCSRAAFLSFMLICTVTGSINAVCNPISSEAELSKNVAKELKVVKEIAFTDKGKPARAVFRSYVSKEPGSLQFDVVIQRSDGKTYEVRPLEDSPMLTEDAEPKAVSFHAQQDSLVVIYPPLTASFTNDSWVTVLDVPTCEWVGVLIDQHIHSIDFPSIRARHNMDDPRFRAEAAFVEKAKFDYGYFTKDTIAKNRTDPKWAEYVWLLDNPALPGGEGQGKMKLQWFPSDKSQCTPMPGDITYRSFRLKGNTELRLCDDDKKRWAWLFLATGYKESYFEKGPAKLDGSKLTLLTRERLLTIDLDTLVWKQSKGSL